MPNTAERNDFYKTVLSLESFDECRDFFEDICTIKEMLDISQRLKMAKMLYDGAGYTEISSETGISTTTISRVSKCLKYGNGGYKTILDRLAAVDKEKEEQSTEQ